MQFHDADTSEDQSGDSAYRRKIGWFELQRCAALNSRAEFLPFTPNIPIMKRKVAGDASETALIKCVACSMHDLDGYRRHHPKMAELPFNSTNKFQVEASFLVILRLAYRMKTAIG